MNKYFHNVLMGISVLPALLVMPAMSDTLENRQVISEDTTYNDLIAEDIASTSSNNGGVFYLQDVQDVTLTFNGTTLFKNNSLTGGGMGGVIGNGWLSTSNPEVWTPYTPGGKIVFNGKTTFEGNFTDNTNGGGAVFNYGVGTIDSPDIVFNDEVSFLENEVTGTSGSVYVGGGAIHNQGGAIVFKKKATFDGNESASKGGAVMTSGAMVFENIAEFTNNTAAVSGGALEIIGGDVIFEKAALFDHNTAGSGSAISIREANSKLTFEDIATFTYNTGTAALWNNGATGKVYFENGAVFDHNTNTANGTLQNAGTVEMSGGSLAFTNNTGSNGGGVKNAGTFSVETTGDVLFDTNVTTSSAGAFDNGGTVTIVANNITFNNNRADTNYGGAIFNAADMSLLGQENVFSNNIAVDSRTIKSGGGAIHNRGNTGTTTLVIGTSDSTNIFDTNISYAHGGAIVARAVDGNTQNSEVTINGTTTFVNNEAGANGGAIWNYVTEEGGTTGTAEFTFNGNTTFRNNVAAGLGGAIYNNSVMVFNGDTIFAGNTANGVANDIYNDGEIEFNGNVTLDGGIIGDGTLTIAEGTTFDIGSASLSQGEISLDGTLLAALRSGSDAQITTAAFSGNGILTLAIRGEDTYHVFGTEVFSTGTVNVESSIYDWVWTNGDKDLVATLKSVEDIAMDNELSTETAVTISNLVTSTSGQLNDLAVAIQETLASGGEEARREVEQASVAIHPETESVVQSVSSSVQSTVTSLAANRMAAPSMGRNGGDVQMTAGGVWVQGIYNKSKQNDAFSGYTRGIAGGLDSTFNKVFTLGAGYAYAHSDVTGTVRDTEIDSLSVFLYGQYKPSAWYMNAVANYTMADYTETGSALGLGVSADYGVDSFGANIATGYDFAGGVTPEFALRYMHINSTDYISSLGIKNELEDANYLTASIGTKYAFDLKVAKRLVLRPELSYAIKYDLLSDRRVATVTMPGVNSYALNGERLSRIGGEFGVGMTMNYRGVDLSLNYDIEAREDYTSQSGRVKFRYSF